MANSLQDVVDAALTVLDTHGLEFLSMRRVAAALDVQPSALYHHVPNKQTLLALMADEILARGRRDEPTGSWDERASALCHEFRSAMLAVRDGAEVVATASAFGLGAREPEQRLVAALEGFDDDVAVSGASASVVAPVVSVLSASVSRPAAKRRTSAWRSRSRSTSSRSA